MMLRIAILAISLFVLNPALSQSKDDKKILNTEFERFFDTKDFNWKLVEKSFNKMLKNNGYKLKKKSKGNTLNPAQNRIAAAMARMATQKIGREMLLTIVSYEG